ncbi:MAG TPA: PIN domain-containing protein [Candidatus Sulfotelmatobacter sp.]|nr:PIN domain-containing protein [Candidatus Sulfotelmatobacter sp.]
MTFVDTNVLVYAHDRSETTKQSVAQRLLERLWTDRAGTLSTQVLQEFYVVATRRFDPPMSRRAAREIVDLYGTWPLVSIDLPLIVMASRLEERHRLSFWDALIVEAASRAGATRLVTEDLQDRRTIGGVRIENPFR